MARLTNIVAATAMLATLAAPGLADCKPLRMVATTDLVTLPHHSPMFVPVKFGDVSKLMMLDTGAEVSVLSAKAKEELGLKGHDASIRVYGITGEHSEQFVITPMEFARLKNNNVKLMVMPSVKFDEKDDAGKLRVAGLLGADILGQFDVSIDFARRKLDLLDPDHCEGKVMYWGADILAVVPFQRLDFSQISLPVTLDGQELEATLDTGAAHTTIYEDEAIKRFGLELESSDAPETSQLNATKGWKTHRHVFKTLSFGGVTMTNPEITLIPDKTSAVLNESVGGGRITQPIGFAKQGVLIGMNVLKHLHVYIAYKERKLYITPAAQPKP